MMCNMKQLHVSMLLAATIAVTGVACGGSANVVDVRLTDTGIEMPRSLEVGATEFRITNAGTRDHSMKIAGSGIEVESVELPPGERGSLELTLPEGAGFNVFCAVGDHTAKEEGVIVRVK